MLATLVVAGVVLGFALLYAARTVLFLLFVAIVLATALRPFVERLERHGATRTGAVVGVYAVLAVMFVGLIVVAGPVILDQAMAMVQAAPEFYRTFRSYLVEFPSVLVNRIASQLPDYAATTDQPDAVQGTVEQVSQTFRYVGVGLRGVLAFFVVMLLSFYWALQEERTIRWLLLLVPVTRRDEARDLVASMQEKVGAYLLGQGVLCLSVGILCLIAFLAIGLPYAVVLAVTAGLLEAVPYFGPVLGAIPAVLAALSTDPSKAIWVVVASTTIQQLENHVLVPRVMDQSVGVRPVVTLLAIAGFGTLFGLAGAILAIPMAAIAQLALDRFVLRREALEPRPAELPGRGPINALRYQVQDLVYDIRLRNRHREDPVAEEEEVEELIESIAEDLNQELALRHAEIRSAAEEELEGVAVKEAVS
jgi:predicted PurR-regulated permease PerM